MCLSLLMCCEWCVLVIVVRLFLCNLFCCSCICDVFGVLLNLSGLLMFVLVFLVFVYICTDAHS